MQGEAIREQFKLHLIKDEEDLHNYKNLLNAMAALFFTNHRTAEAQGMFKAWLQLHKGKARKPAIEIDTELANAQYENQAEIAQL